MKRKVIVIIYALALLVGCSKEKISISKKVTALWWGGDAEEFGSLATASGTISSIGNVGDLQWWSSQCIVQGNVLYAFGENGSNPAQLKLYQCDLENGNLLSQVDVVSGLTNVVIAGVYNNQTIVLAWNGSNEVFGTLNAASGTISPIGKVGDLQWWNSQCIVSGNTLYVFDENGANSLPLKLYLFDLDNGNLLSQVDVASGLTNMAMAGTYNNKIIVVGWNGSNEVFGTLNTASGSTSTIGQVGDLHQWSMQCIVQENTLYALGNEINSAQLNLYQCDLDNGNLLSKKAIPSGYVNLTLAKFSDQKNNTVVDN